MAGTATPPAPSPAGRSLVLAGEPPLIGREREIAVVEQVIGDPTTPGLVLTGPLGVGRTRLLREAVRSARRAGRRTVLVRGAGPGVALGSLAGVVPPVTAHSDHLVLLQHALTELRGDGDDPVIAVDDAHRLDELTRTVVEQLLLAGDATVIATERSDHGGGDRLRMLGDDVLPLAIGALPDDSLDRLLAAMLDGAVEARTAQRLRGLVSGHPLLLREFLRDGYESGHLTRDDGLWRWDGPIHPPHRLTMLVLADIGSTGRAALELLAARGPMDPAQLTERYGHDLVARLHRPELLRSDRSGRVELAPFATAAFGERSAEPPPAPPRRTTPGHPMAAAAEANRALEHRRAERAARPALCDDVDGRAHLELIEALRWQDRHDELPVLLDEADRRVQTADGRARLALTRALLAHRASANATKAARAALAAAPPPAAGPAAHPRHGGAAPRSIGCDEGPPSTTAPGGADTAVLEAAAWLDGQGLAPPEGDALPAGADATVRSGAGPPDDDRCTDGRWAALTAAARAARLAAAGRAAEALDAVAQARTAQAHHDTDHAESALARLLLVDAELCSLHLTGRPDDLERAADDAHRANLTAPDWAGDAWVAWHRGRAALSRGDLTRAERCLAEARTGTSRRDPLGLAAECTATLALVHVLRGDPGSARSLLDQLPEPVPLAAHAAVARARTWLHTTDITAPIPVHGLLAEATAAQARGDLVTEAVLLHDAARLGHASRVADRLATLATESPETLPQLFAAHAAAAATGRHDGGTPLDRVATELAAAGARPEAADAAAAAATVHHRAGERRRSAASAARAIEWADACGIRTPALHQLIRPRLTSREQEIAGLVADGASNTDVARRLFVSVRTVETHLAHAYAKLGIDNRSGLAAALPTRRPRDR